MVYLILTITGIVATLLVKKAWSQKTQIIFILLALVLCLVLFFSIKFIFQTYDIVEKGDSSLFSQIPWLEIALYFIMILGMAGKYFFDLIGTTKKNKIIINKWQLIKPLFISPLVFGTIYASIESITSIVLLVIFAFQNGFFWQTVLNKND
ncbi:hypothetical protein JW964_13905 [candidate division KSB1 bacterium]|nr:hypothetical protein [candidate division KSB1 bacterium]